MPLPAAYTAGNCIWTDCATGEKLTFWEAVPERHREARLTVSSPHPLQTPARGAPFTTGKRLERLERLEPLGRLEGLERLEAPE